MVKQFQSSDSIKVMRCPADVYRGPEAIFHKQSACLTGRHVDLTNTYAKRDTPAWPAKSRR